jgi:hypothetical protein
MTGNKMTPLNLATIFGPNLLHKQKNSDKEFSVQSSARAEESTAVISVLQQREDWWLGQLAGTQGWFPKDYVTLEPDNTE